MFLVVQKGFSQHSDLQGTQNFTQKMSLIEKILSGALQELRLTSSGSTWLHQTVSNGLHAYISVLTCSWRSMTEMNWRRSFCMKRSIPSSMPTNRPSRSPAAQQEKGDTSASLRGQERPNRTARGRHVFSSSPHDFPRPSNTSSGPEERPQW